MMHQVCDCEICQSNAFKTCLDYDVKLWVVGRFLKETDLGSVWNIQGVFESNDKAIEACRDETYFIGSITKNRSLPHDQEEWPGCYYPLYKEGL